MILIYFLGLHETWYSLKSDTSRVEQRAIGYEGVDCTSLVRFPNAPVSGPLVYCAHTMHYPTICISGSVLNFI